MQFPDCISTAQRPIYFQIQTRISCERFINNCRRILPAFNLLDLGVFPFHLAHIVSDKAIFEKGDPAIFPLNTGLLPFPPHKPHHRQLRRLQHITKYLFLLSGSELIGVITAIKFGNLNLESGLGEAVNFLSNESFGFS